MDKNNLDFREYVRQKEKVALKFMTLETTNFRNSMREK